MVRRIKEELIDDIDGSEATTSFTFAFEGVSYEIDLNDDNAEKFRDTITPWIEASAKVRKGGTSSAPATRAARSGNLGEIREWAKAQGHKVSHRGRVPQKILDAYEAAH